MALYRSRTASSIRCLEHLALEARLDAKIGAERYVTENADMNEARGYERARCQWRLYCLSESWEGAAARAFADVHLEDLETAARHADPNVRLLSISLMIALEDLRAIPVLRNLLADDSSNIPSAFQADEFEPVQTVGNVAAEAISRLQNLSRDTSSTFRD